MTYKVEIFRESSPINIRVSNELEFLGMPIIAKGQIEQVREGADGRLVCNATGDPPPLITWQRNGVRIETGMRYVVEKDALNVKQVKVADSGIYVCTATNEAGTDQQAFTLEVISE